MPVRHLTNNEEFSALQAEVGPERWILMDFTATWCGPCKRMSPIFEKISEEHPEICCCKIDVDEASDLAQQFQVASIPYFVLWADGRMIDSMAGASIPKLEDFVTRCQGEIPPLVSEATAEAVEETADTD